jgi:hypothetical protein
VDTIKALKEIRDITMNRLTLIHKEIYDIADAAIREASAEGCRCHPEPRDYHPEPSCPIHGDNPASPPKTVRDWPAGDLPPCPPYQNGLSYSPPKEERRELGDNSDEDLLDSLYKFGKYSGQHCDGNLSPENWSRMLVVKAELKYRLSRSAPAQGEKKHEEGYMGMRVELVNHGGEDKFEIILHKGDGIRVLSVEKAEQLANWIHELLDVQSAAGS